MYDFARNSSTFSLCFTLILLFHLLLDLGISFYKIFSLLLIDNIWGRLFLCLLVLQLRLVNNRIHVSSHYHPHFVVNPIYLLQ